MLTKQLPVINELGLHARVACRIVRCAGEFQSSVVAIKNDKSFDLKNVTGVITVNAKCGDVLTVQFDGADEEQAAKTIEELFAEKFGEK
ncbi:HPr family phosphocarrier protein [Oscillospiraceae bacterium PP1C4]